jgi:hypothetical protein
VVVFGVDSDAVIGNRDARHRGAAFDTHLDRLAGAKFDGIGEEADEHLLDALYAFSPAPGRGVFHVSRSGVLDPLSLDRPAPKNRALLSTGAGVVFCGYDGAV